MSRWGLLGPGPEGVGRLTAFPLVALLSLAVLDEVDESAFNVLGPDLRNAFHLSNAAFVSVRIAVASVALLIGLGIGYLSDRAPRRRLVPVAATTIGVFGLALSLAPATIVALFVLRLGSSLGRQINRSTHQSMLADYYPTGSRARVFGLWRLAAPIGLLIGPLFAGGIAWATGSWRAAVGALVVPSIIVALVVRRLPEPPRGVQERLAAGADSRTAAIEEEPPSWEEAWRALNGVQTLRRIWVSLPWLVGGIFGLAVILPLYYQEEFHASAGLRGLLSAGMAPAQILGVLVAIPLTTHLLAHRPGRVLWLFAAAATAAAVGLVVVAAAPSLWVAFVGAAFAHLCLAMLLPGVGALVSLIVPPRARGLSFSVIEIWALPGLVFVVLAARIGDAYGLRWSIVVMTAVFLVGAYIVASAGGKVAADIASSRAVALAQAEARLSRERGEANLLVCRGLEVHYGQVQILFGVDLEIADGEIVALLGANGAGKSTLLKAICGLVDPTAGAIIWDGRDVTHTSPQLALARGIAMMPGGRGVFPTLTVAENLTAASWSSHGDPDLPGRRADVMRRFPVLAERLSQPAGNLSGGEQQMLALSMAFLARPRLLLIDELSLGLAPVIVERLLDIVREIHAGGTTVVLVEQSVNLALTLAQRAVFLEKGELRFEGPTADLLGRDDILRSVYLGGASERLTAVGRAASPTSSAVMAPHALESIAVSRSYGGIRAVDEASLRVAPGEIVGLIGPNGAGKTTLLDLLSGFVRADSGRVLVGGTDMTVWRPDRRARAGLGRSFQDAALFPSLTVREALALAHDRRLRSRDLVSAALALPDQRVEESLLRARVDELLELVGITAFADKFVAELSTGSRRIVDIACCLAHDPSVLLLDEPSSGIAQREAEALAPLLRSIRDTTRMAMIIIEHDMPLISAVADRLYALDLGRVIAEGPSETVLRDPRVVAAYLGGESAAIERSGERRHAGRPRAVLSGSNGGNRA